MPEHLRGIGSPGSIADRLPLGAIVVLAGLHAQPSDVTSLGAALEAVERQPAGPWALSAMALGLIAFGAFSFVEARWRRIRPPREVL